MKNKIGQLFAIPLTLVSTVGLATTTDFEMHGYIKSGILMNSDGNRSDAIGLMPDGKWRLGNEQNTKIELLPTIKIQNDNGSYAKIRANLTHETTCTADWNCVDGDGHEIQFREGYAELGNLDFAPDAVFWAGKRYSSSNTSNHQFDWEYIQYNGTGGGVDNVKLGFARFDIGLYAFNPSGDNARPPADTSQQGYPDDYSVNAWFKSIAGTGLDIQLVAHSMNSDMPWDENVAEDGFGVTAVYNFDGFYNFANGYSRFVVQYGQGLAAGDSLGKNGWGWANLDDTTSYRLVLDGLANVSGWDISTFAFYQQDSDFRWWSGASEGWDRTRMAVGVRPYQQLSDHFAMQYEIGYEYLDDENLMGVDGRGEGGLTKVTVAPTITLNQGFWGRPQLRAFVTYATWDKDVADAIDGSFDWGTRTIGAGGYTRNDDTSAINFGLQAEVWF